jgi:hypothetical protein
MDRSPGQQQPSLTKISRFTIRRIGTGLPDGRERWKSKPGGSRFRIVRGAHTTPRLPAERPYSLLELLEHPELQESILEKHSPDDGDPLIDSFLH